MGAKNILIIGANFSNKGAEAMLKTVCAEMSKRHSEVHFYMTCKIFEKDLAKKANVEPVYDVFSDRKKKIRKYIYLIKGKSYKMVYGKNKPFVEELPITALKKQHVTFDYLIDISGFAYGDNWGKGQMYETVKLINAINKGSDFKCIFMPQAWGDFSRSGMQQAINVMLKKATTYYARDPQSQQFIANAIGCEKSDINLMPDIVFAYQRDIERKKDDEKGRKKVIGISPNLRMYEKSDGKFIDNTYVKFLLSFIQNHLDDGDCKFVLIPNEIKPKNANTRDDRYICELIYEHFNNDDVVFNAAYRSSEEIKKAISELDILIGSRFHALIFALSMGVPSVALSWSHKYKELFKLFDLDAFVIEQDDFNLEKLNDLVHDLFSNRDKWSKLIDQKSMDIKLRIDGLFDQL